MAQPKFANSKCNKSQYLRLHKYFSSLSFRGLIFDKNMFTRKPSCFEINLIVCSSRKSNNFESCWLSCQDNVFGKKTTTTLCLTYGKVASSCKHFHDLMTSYPINTLYISPILDKKTDKQFCLNSNKAFLKTHSKYTIQIQKKTKLFIGKKLVCKKYSSTKSDKIFGKWRSFCRWMFYLPTNFSTDESYTDKVSKLPDIFLIPRRCLSHFYLRKTQTQGPVDRINPLSFNFRYRYKDYPAISIDHRYKSVHKSITSLLFKGEIWEGIPQIRKNHKHFFSQNSTIMAN